MDPIAIIPARGGSKRIPGKNIRSFCGQPMISWSIQAALASGCFARIVVSTDDPEIADIAVRWGAEVPFRRPDELSGDFVGTTAVIANAISNLGMTANPESLVCCLYATAPFVLPDDLRAGHSLVSSSDVDYVFAATEYGFPVQRSLRFAPGGGVEMLFPEHRDTRSQDLPPLIHDAGQFYWGSTASWLEARAIFSQRSLPLLLPRFRVEDIDTEDDWRRAEALFKANTLLPKEGKRLTDGEHPNIRFRQATLADAALVYAWRNHPATREHFFDSRALSFQEHLEWYSRALKDPRRVVLIGELERSPLGVARFDLQGTEAEISVFLDPSQVGRGLGGTFISSAIAFLLAAEHRNVRTVLARVKSANAASRAAFKKVGFGLDHEVMRLTVSEAQNG